MDVPQMTSAQVLEYRAVDTERVFYSYAEVVQAYGSDVTVYSRPFGLEAWGWHSGPFYFDARYKASQVVS